MVWLIAVIVVLQSRTVNTSPPFSLCNVSSFYASLGSDFLLTASADAVATQLHALISPHNVIPYTSTSLDTSDALKITDADASNPGFVFDVYRDTIVETTNYIGAPDFDGTNLAWSKEHLWPNSKGLHDAGPDYSDIFNLRVCNQNLNNDRQNKQYSNCSTGCTSPATSPTVVGAADTAEGLNAWLPPANVRGDIARSLFYMTLRYDGSETNTENLNFVDANSPANVSTLIAWHKADPVDDYETNRNMIICEQFQGNRNPFIDFPELVDLIFVDKEDTSKLDSPPVEEVLLIAGGVIAGVLFAFMLFVYRLRSHQKLGNFQRTSKQDPHTRTAFLNHEQARTNLTINPIYS